MLWYCFFGNMPKLNSLIELIGDEAMAKIIDIKKMLEL